MYWVRRQVDTERFSSATRKRQLVVEMQGIEYHRHAFGIGYRFFEELYPLGRHFIRQVRKTGEILARPRERRGNSCPHRTVADAANDWDAARVCVEERLDDIAADSEQQVGLL